MDYLDDIITKQIKSLPSDDGIYENFKNNYNRLKRDIKSFNRKEELVKKIAIFPKLSKRISDLKKIKKSEKKFLDFTNKMDQVIRGIKNKRNKEYFDDQILLKLKHIILSHQGSFQNGTPVPPRFPEALFIHLLDTFDGKMDIMQREINNNSNQNWTNKHNHFYRELWKK